MQEDCTINFTRIVQDLVSLLQKPATNEHYSLPINILALVNFDVNLAEALCERPTETLLLLDKAALIAQQQLEPKEQSQAVLTVKHLVHVRVLGKSQLMQYAAKLSPRGVISSGRGSSSAGLTVTAIRDGGQWALEAGALILADGQLLNHAHSINSL
ncbi:hypothetical protein ABBQ38_004088 [Trebouxia sp. C0009 RCD-2024]